MAGVPCSVLGAVTLPPCPAPAADSFPRGNSNFPQSFIIPVQLDFKPSREQIVLSCVFQWHVGGAGTIPGWSF